METEKAGIFIKSVVILLLVAVICLVVWFGATSVVAKKQKETLVVALLEGMRTDEEWLLDDGRGTALIRFLRGETANGPKDAELRLYNRLALWQKKHPDKLVLQIRPVQGFV